MEHLEHTCFLTFCTSGILQLITVISFIVRFYYICLSKGSLLCQHSKAPILVCSLRKEWGLCRYLQHFYPKCPRLLDGPSIWASSLTAEALGSNSSLSCFPPYSRRAAAHSVQLLHNISSNHSKTQLLNLPLSKRDGNKRCNLTKWPCTTTHYSKWTKESGRQQLLLLYTYCFVGCTRTVGFPLRGIISNLSILFEVLVYLEKDN